MVLISTHHAPSWLKVRELFAWAVSLRDRYTSWPANLPRPEEPRVVYGIDYAAKANGVFVNAAAYLLFHEYAHLVNGHGDIVAAIRSKPVDQVSEDDLVTLRQIETEADVDAREALLDSYAPQIFDLAESLEL